MSSFIKELVVTPHTGRCFKLEVLTQKTAALVRTVDEEQEAADILVQKEIKAKIHVEKMLEECEKNFNDLGDLYDANNRMFNRLLNKIKILFDLMKCDSSVLKDLLGENQEVTQHNYKLYLGLVETEVIFNLESHNSSVELLPAIGFTHSETNKPTSVKSVKSILRTIKSGAMPVGSHFDRKVITLACPECDVPAITTKSRV